MIEKVIFRNAEEHPDYPGFYYVPGYPQIVIKKDGTILNLSTNKIAKQYPSKKGYLVFSISLNSKSINLKVHRMLAMAFIEIPQRLKHFPVKKLEVNHDDGNKQNNALTNLEWASTIENVQHAHQNELTSVGKSVLARNVLTGEITRYRSTQVAADTFGAERKKLSRHLLSDEASKVTLNWCVFKRDDGTPWPVLHPFDIVENKWDLHGIWCGLNVETNVALVLNHIQDLSNFLPGISWFSYLQFIKKHGDNVPYKGWKFQFFESVLGIDISQLQGKPTKRGGKQKKVRVTNLVTNEVQEFSILYEAAIAMKMSPETIRTLINHQGGKRGNLLFEWA